MTNGPIADDPGHLPIVDWEIDRHSMTGDVLVRFRYFTASMQGLDEAERGPVYALTVEKAHDLGEALQRVLRRRTPET